MSDILIIFAVLLLLIVIILQVIHLRRRIALDLSPLDSALQSVRQNYEKVERSVRDEIARNREEASRLGQQSREELNNIVKGVGEILNRRFDSVSATIDDKLHGLHTANEEQSVQSRVESSAAAQRLREEVVRTLTALSEVLAGTITQLSENQKEQLATFSCNLAVLTDAVDQRLVAVRQSVDDRVTAVQSEIVKQLSDARQESATASIEFRREITTALTALGETITRTMSEIAGLQKQQLDSFSAQLAKLTEANETKLVEAWRAQQLSAAAAKLTIYRAFVEGDLEAPKHLGRKVHELYFNPQHEEFNSRTMWSLSNAFTSAFKELDPVPQFRATAKLGRFLESATAT